MKLLIILVAFTIVTFSGFSQAQTCKGSRNFIFLVHGIGGNAATFGSLSDVLIKHDPCFKPVSFVYETGSELTVHEFSNELDAFIQNTLITGGATEEDKISFVMHSQGGLVVSLWLKRAIEKKEKLFNQVDAFITLSTPFWGSSMAKWGRRVFYANPRKEKNPISPFGKFELLDMSYGSATISELNDHYQEIFEAGKHIRGLSIGGLKAGHNPRYGEDDTTVSIYSSRPDHYLMNSTVQSNGIVSIDGLKKTKFHPYVIVRATHFATAEPGVADIPETCLIACDHPSLPYILDHLEHKPIVSTTAEQFTLKKFRLHIYVQDMKKFDIKGEDISFSYKLRKKWIHMVGKRKQRTENGFSFAQFTKGEGKEDLTLIMKVKGIEKGRFLVPVEGGFSTFINLKLDLKGQ